jgi:osmotically-inducible protein OsmY
MNIAARSIILALGIGISATTLPGCAPLFASGVTVGGLASADRRTLGTQIEDQTIQLRGTQRLKEALPGSEESYGYVTSFNRRVLLTGRAPTAKARQQAEQLAGTLENVRLINNEIQVSQGALSNSSARDTAVTARIKAALLQASDVESTSIKVVTEAQTVYLLGIVTQDEGKRAAGVASRVSGVEKVVTLFDYITDQDLADLRRENKQQVKATTGE